MQKIYCISGLGADEKVFQFLDLSFAKPDYIRWIQPLKKESLHKYANRLKQKFIHESNPVIIGLSLGGMIAVEIAKEIPGATVILISSAKTIKEIPFYWKMLRHAPVHKVLSDKMIKRSSVIQEFFLGASLDSTKQYIKNAHEKADPYFVRWAIEALINWENLIVPSNVIHIHGTKDNLLPHRFVKANITIKDGGHLLIIENYKEVSALLKQIISKE